MADPSSNDEQDDLITLEDIDSILCHNFNVADKDTLSYLEKQQVMFAKIRLNRINKCISDFYKIWPEASKLELYIAYELSFQDCDQMASKIADKAFRLKVRDELNSRLGIISEPTQKKDDCFVNQEEEESLDDENDTDFNTHKDYAKCIHKQSKRKAVHKNVEKPKEIPEEVWNKWSETRKISYFLEDTMPNAYYYRHNPQGEVQRNGQWTNEEKKLFLKRLEEMKKIGKGGCGDWGLFSKAIPGRVGYQCSNYYRKLVYNGEIEDENYVIGSDGKIHHLSRVHVKNGKVIADHYKKGKNRAKDAKSTKKRDDRESDEKSNSDGIQSVFLFSSMLGMKASDYTGRYAEWAEDNPLLKAIDQVTQKPMKVPTISPDGYVLDYQTWLDILNKKNENPFTRLQMNKRQLVRLTVDNYEQYKSKIKNL